MQQYFTTGGEAFSKMRTYLSIKSEVSCAALIIILAALSRLCMIYFAQAEAGDTSTYINFAENIIRGCGLSHSAPSSNECILTSGGYFPGYPAFIAFVWILFGKSVYAVLIAQLICYLLALMWLLIAIFRLTNSNKVMCAVGILLALSPLQLGWFRFILTEPLAIATATWFLAELIISVSNKKLRVYHLALALSASVYVRPDSIFMILGPCVIAFYIYDFKKSMQQISLIITLTTIPVSVWLVRNYTIGHAPLSMTSSAAPIAPGYFLWLDTWVVNEYERSDANFPLWRREYSKIDIHASKYIAMNELEKAKVLINDLSTIDGQEFPENIDKKFNQIAIEKSQKRSKFRPIQIYAERTFWMFLNPFSSWGMPLQVDSMDGRALKEAFKNRDLTKFNYILSNYKFVFFGKATMFFYRIVIFTIFISITAMSFFKSRSGKFNEDKPMLNTIILALALVTFARLCFFVYLGALESRYLALLISWIEVCCMMRVMSAMKFAHGAK